MTEEIRRFIRDCIDSAAKLETLLLLAEQADRDWSADEISRELRSAPELAARCLTELQAAGLLEETAGGSAEGDTVRPLLQKSEPGELRYRFAPLNTNLILTVEALDRLYRERRYSVLDLIYAEPEDDPEKEPEPEKPAAPPEPTDRIQAFSDAFRLWRDKER